jgi:hypothetical protein
MRHVEPDGKIWFGIHEVYYDDDVGHKILRRHSVKHPKSCAPILEQMMDAFEYPILEHNATD